MSAHDQSPPRRLRGRTLAVAGAAGVLALGAVVAATSRSSGPSAAGTADAAGKMRILINPVKPPPVPKPGAPLKVLPPEMAAAAPRAPDPPPPLEDEPWPDAAGFPGDAPPFVQPEPVTQAEPSFACVGRLSLAQEMVCADPRLAALDRELDRAYRGALRAGVPAADLRAEQGGWRLNREDAAHVSPRALVRVYEARIAELEDMAAYPPPGGW